MTSISSHQPERQIMTSCDIQIPQEKAYSKLTQEGVDTLLRQQNCSLESFVINIDQQVQSAIKSGQRQNSIEQQFLDVCEICLQLKQAHSVNTLIELFHAKHFV